MKRPASSPPAECDSCQCTHQKRYSTSKMLNLGVQQRPPQHAGSPSSLTGKALCFPPGLEGGCRTRPLLQGSTLSLLSSIPTPVIQPCPGPSDPQPQCPGNARFALVLVLVVEVTQLMWTLVSLASGPWGAWRARWKEYRGF